MLPEIIFKLPESSSLQQWQAQLETELPFEVISIDATQHRRVYYYDSFDWLLHQRGETLEWHEDGPASVLMLCKRANRQEVDRVNIDHPPPRFPAELPTGSMKKALTQRFDLRAMLPKAVLETRCQRLRVVNRDLKSLAFLDLCEHTVNDSAGKPSVIRKEICIQPLHKHRKTGDKLADDIEQRWSLQREDQFLLDLALAGQGKQVATYSGKLAVPLDAGMRADASLRKILLALLDTMEANEQGTIDNLDTEFLHDFRIAIRRTRSALTQVKSVLPAQTTARYAKKFAWLGDITTPTRDLDVYVLKFESLRDLLPKAMRADLEPLREFLIAHQQQEQMTLARHLQSAAYRRIKEQWRKLLSSPLPGHPSASHALKPTAEVANKRIYRMYRRVLREGHAITATSPATDLHELRKSCKKLRYLMEFFQSLYPTKKIRLLIRELKGLQDNLGDFQDLEVQMHTLGQYREQMTEDGVMQPGTRTAFDTLLKRLHSATDDVRNDFESRFNRFSSRQNRQRFKSLFHPNGSRSVDEAGT